MRGILAFDGRCGMCTRVVNRMARWDRRGRLRIEPFQTPEIAELLGVTDDHFTESAWWLDSSGEIYAGEHAMNAALSAALGTRLPLWFFSVPGVGWLENVVYRWVATHRYHFRGVTPLCEAQPERCA